LFITSSIYEPRGIPAHATAWRLAEQPFPRGSPLPPLCGQEALHCRQAEHASEHKGDQAETLNLS
jgi:hypothetical protein